VGRGHTVTESDPKRPGKVLRARRETLDVTVREVAETLNLSMTMIEAIEADDASKLPGTVFARGYVRAYARLLELDPKPLLEYYPKTEVAEPAGEMPSERPIWEWIRRRPGLVLGSAAGALVMLLVLVVLLLWPENGENVDGAVAEDTPGAMQPGLLAERDAWPAAPERGPDAGSAATQPTAGRTPGAAGVPAADAAAGARADPATDSPPAANSPSPGSSPTDDAPETAVAGAGFETAAAAPAPEGSARRISAAGDDRLAFGFSDDCWVEVKSSSGANLYSDLNRAGSELELVGEGPFRILLGYAPGARLSFNGEPVPLAPHTRNNVATLVLGQ